MTAPTLNSQALGNVETIRWRKGGDIEEITLPGTDSSGNITFDYGGVSRTITVQGSFTGTTAAIRTSIQNIAGIMDGDQSTSIDFTSDEVGDGVGGAGSISVKITSFDIAWQIPSNRADYTLQLVEGD